MKRAFQLNLRIGLLFAFVSFCINPLFAQKKYGNEWIDYNKTYYSFKVAPVSPVPTATNAYAGTHENFGDYKMLHRIPYSTLASKGLAQIPVEYFQLWRNGEEVAIYTVPSSGMMDVNGYLEFWGDFNDGNSDADLFRKPEYQLNPRWSLFGDTALYHLTVNRYGENLRIVPAENNASTSNLTPTSQIIHKIKVSPKIHLSSGRTSNVGVRSSSYELGEGYSRSISANTLLSVPLGGNLQVASGTPANIKAVILSGSLTGLPIELRLNEETLVKKTIMARTADTLMFNGIDPLKLQATPPVIGFYAAAIRPQSYAFYQVELEYLRNLVFSNNQASFQFQLPASTQPILLKFDNFNTNSSLEKLVIDFTNRKRYVATISGTSLLVELPPSTANRNLVLTTINTATTGQTVKQIAALEEKRFVDFTNSALQGDYLIISNNRLISDNSAGGNQVQAYSDYRSSAEGGNYKANVYEIQDLVDNFAYGIPMHPLSIRRFIHYAKDKFGSKTRAVLLIGRGVTYDQANRSDLGRQLNFVPTWGEPASDNLLASANNQNITPILPIGRIAAIDAIEIKNYLEKIKVLEAAQRNPAVDHSYQKNALMLIGGLDQASFNLVTNYMQQYKESIERPLLGGEGHLFAKVENPNTSADYQKINSLIENGTGLITYFGHSSPTSIDYPINNPDELNMPAGKLPVFIANGCSAAQIFDLNANRMSKRSLTIGEKFVLAPDKGSSVFLSTTHLGIVQYLHLYSKPFIDYAADSLYGKSVGEIHNAAIQHMMNQNGYEDMNVRLTAEETLLHGDPVVRMYTVHKSDFSVEKITLAPGQPALETDSIAISFHLKNSGPVTSDSVLVRVTLSNPLGQHIIVKEWFEKQFSFNQVVSVKIPVSGMVNVGMNSIRIDVNPNQAVGEIDFTNNNLEKTFEILRNSVTPVYPGNFSMVTSWPQKLHAFSSAAQDNALREWRLEMDTTINFNSPLKYTLSINSKPGNLEFTPTNTLSDGQVYYWHIVETINGEEFISDFSSFTYFPGQATGFNQQHFYQHQQSALNGMTLNPVSKNWEFADKMNNLFVVQSIYPTSGNEDGHFTVIANNYQLVSGGCVANSIALNILDPLSFKPWINPASSTNAWCKYSFNFKYFSSEDRKAAMDFINGLPKGVIVAMRLITDPDPGQPRFPTGKADSAFAQYWKNDELIFGEGNSLYHTLLKQGFYNLDELDHISTFGFVFVKDDSSKFKPVSRLSDGMWDRLTFSADIPMKDTTGTVASPWFGPAASWEQIHWRGLPVTEPNGQSTDKAYLKVYGKKSNGEVVELFRLDQAMQDVALANEYSIDPQVYRHLQLKLFTADEVNGTPFPLDYWRVQYKQVAEGTLTPESSLAFNIDPSTGGFDNYLEAGIDQINLSVGFKNISPLSFVGAIPVNVSLENVNGTKTTLLQTSLAALATNQNATIQVNTPVTREMLGAQKLRIMVNPEMAVPEYSLKNNLFYLNFNVINPLNTPGIKTFTGNGNWSDPSKWMPAGVPVCSDKVYILGNCTVDIAGAVADSLTIHPGATLKMGAPGSKLNVGCAETGGSKLVMVNGNLMVENGTLQVNGGIQVAPGAQFSQKGGNIFIDPTTASAAGSLALDMPENSNSVKPVAPFAVGGYNLNPASPYSKFSSGMVSFLGGNLHIIEPPYNTGNLSVYFSVQGTGSLSANASHQLIAGTDNSSLVNNSLENPFVMRAENNSSGAPVISGSLIGRTSALNGRRILFAGPAPFTWWFRGKILAETGSDIRVSAPHNIKIGED